MKKNKTILNNYLVKQLPKATAFVNKDLAVIHVSDKWIADFGFVSDAVLGNSIEKLFKESNKTWSHILKNALKSKQAQTTSELYIDSNGRNREFEIHTIPWHDIDENVIGTILQTEDITEKSKNNFKLRKLELISEQMSKGGKIGFWNYDFKKEKVYWGNKTKEIHEVDSDFKPTLENTLNFYEKGYSRNTISMTLSKAITEETSYEEKLQIVTAKGKKIWVKATGQPRYENEKFVGFVGTIQNINDFYLAELKQQNDENLLRTLIDNLPLNIYIKDLESRKILANQAEAEWCGTANESELLGKDDFDVYDYEIAKNFREEDLQVMKSQEPIIRKETIHTRNDGSTTNLSTSKIPLIDTDNQTYGLVGITMDISDLKLKEKELRSLIKVTSSQNEKLINFAHIVSHNLRSHTSNFAMLLSFLEQEKVALERQKIIDMLVNSSNNLLETIENLNDVIDINSNYGVQKKRINLKNRIQATTQSLKADLVSQNVKIINKISNQVKINVVPAYIDSILNNFLTNAITYKSTTRDAVVVLSAEQEDEYTVLSIADNGIGIDLEKHSEKLFGMYKTFHDNVNAKGIGLFITKNQIEAMKGKVTVKSEVNKGTTFKIYFNEKD